MILPDVRPSTTELPLRIIRRFLSSLAHARIDTSVDRWIYSMPQPIKKGPARRRSHTNFVKYAQRILAIVSLYEPDGVCTVIFCRTCLPSNAAPTGDSFEILPFGGLASADPTIV